MKNQMVLVEGFEPSILYRPGIFLLLHVAMTALLRCSLDYVFSISYDLGGWYIVSTHLFGTIFSTIRFCLSMTIGTKQLKVFNYIIVCVSIFMMNF